MIDLSDPQLVEALRHAATSLGSKLAVDAISTAAKRYVTQIAAWIRKPDLEAIATAAVERVREEAAAFPPKEAIQIAVHAGPVVSGNDASMVSGEESVALALRIWNRADFRIDLAKLRGKIEVNDGEHYATYEIDERSEFSVGPREIARRAFAAYLPRKAEIPRFTYGSVVAATDITALVMGPWPDEPHNDQTFRLDRVWLRVSPELLAAANYDDTDLINILDNWANNQTHALLHDARFCELAKPVQLPDLDRTLGLPPGSAARLLSALLTKYGWEVKSQGSRTLVATPGAALEEDAKLAHGIF